MAFNVSVFPHHLAYRRAICFSDGKALVMGFRTQDEDITSYKSQFGNLLLTC